jgi:hypothetical protein
MRPLACWGCRFESRRGDGYLSRVSVVCCQVEVSASGRSLVQRSPNECGVSECDSEASIMRSPWPTRGCCAIEKRKYSASKRLSQTSKTSVKNTLHELTQGRAAGNYDLQDERCCGNGRKKKEVS